MTDDKHVAVTSARRCGKIVMLFLQRMWYIVDYSR